MDKCIQRVFGRPRVFLPVLHLPGGVKGALASARVAVESGADGVFLINQGMSREGVLAVIPVLRAQHPGLWIGVNLLGYPIHLTLALPEAPAIDGIWTDDAGVDSGNPADAAAEAYLHARRAAGWQGLYFGGTAFKTQRDIPAQDLPAVARRAATFMDVVTTSGRGTGVAAEQSKVKTIRAAIPGVPMALASGVTPENVEVYLPDVEAYLVATGIEQRFGVLDPARTAVLAGKIHEDPRP